MQQYDLVKNQLVLANILERNLFEKTGKTSFVAKDFSMSFFQNGVIIGGAIGKTNFETFHLELLAVKDNYRGQGIGTRLVVEAEKFAKEHNCVLMTVNTQNYEAKSFYEKLDFKIFAQLKDVPFNGTTRYY